MTVSKLQGGDTLYFSPWKGLKPGFGGSVSVGFVPQSLEAVYGGRANGGAAVYVTLRPAAHGMSRTSTAHSNEVRRRPTCTDA